MDILTILKKDHNTVKKIIKDLLNAKTDTKKFLNLLEELEKEIIAHARAEEKTIYQELLGNKSTESLVLESETEHELVEHLLSKLKRIDEQEEDSLWKATLIVLKESLEHHIEEEESEMFSKCRKMFSKEDLNKFGENFIEAKESFLEEQKDERLSA